MACKPMRQEEDVVPEKTPLIEMRGITKAFPGVVANDNISFSVHEGEIHALLGENGAGKSTLMSILSGLYKPDSGSILLHGEERVFRSPKEAIASGIGMVHQHFKLAGAFTVAENVVLGTGGPIYNAAKVEEEILNFSREYRMEIDPKAKVWQLSVGEQQRVEILKALYRKANILVLDEPTAVLTPQEAQALFDTLREMVKKGRTVIIITHKLAEVTEIAHRVTVLRRGRTVGTVGEDDINHRTLSNLMIGAEIAAKGADVRESNTPILRVKNLTVKGDRGTPVLQDVDFEINKGEILGVAGVAGNGQRELCEAISGLRQIAGGEIVMGENGETLIANRGVRNAIKAGVAFVPEDRLGMGLVGNMDIGENLLLKSYRSGGLFLNSDTMKKAATKVVADYDVSVADVSAPVRLMSGGNLQKVLLARELQSKPNVLAVAYPTRGLDIMAADRIYNLLLDERERGCGILMISEDLEALLRYADRIMVLCNGRVMGIIPRAQARTSEIGMMMMGTTRQEVMASYETYNRF